MKNEKEKQEKKKLKEFEKIFEQKCDEKSNHTKNQVVGWISRDGSGGIASI